MRRRWTWLSGGALVGTGLILVSWLGLRAIMGRICTDAKPGGPQKSAEHAFFSGLPRVLNIAHRGASAYAPEHTLRAYELALEQGADVLELDLRNTRDGVLLVAHDADLQRTHGLALKLNQHDFADLAAATGERCPLRLEQVLSHFPTARFNLELKDEALGVAGALAALLERAGARHRVLVASGHDDVLAEFRRTAGSAVATSASKGEVLDYRLCQLMGRSCPTPFVALQLPALGWMGLTDPDFIRHAHELGLEVHYWTIDDEEEQRTLIASGADGIMTNHPDRLARVLATASESRP